MFFHNCNNPIIVVISKGDIKENLECKILNLETKVSTLETKITELVEKIELQELQINTLQNDSFLTTAKVSVLETKMAQLVEKVELQDLQINTLQNEWKNATKFVPNSVEINDRQQVGNNPIFRTCHEINEANPLLGSGMHWIDPDGKGTGLQACKMEQGLR